MGASSFRAIIPPMISTGSPVASNSAVCPMASILPHSKPPICSFMYLRTAAQIPELITACKKIMQYGLKLSIDNIENKNRETHQLAATYHTDNIAIPGMHGCRSVDSGVNIIILTSYISYRKYFKSQFLKPKQPY